MTPVARLYAAVRASSSPLADALGAQPPAPTADGGDPPLLAAAGPRVAATSSEIELAVVAVHEGYRLHYDRRRALPIEDADLSLLAGDRLYALGLDRLASIGDLAAICELADVIALSAQAHAAGDEELARAAWQVGAIAVGWGSAAVTEDAKARARAGDPEATSALLAAADIATSL